MHLQPIFVSVKRICYLIYLIIMKSSIKKTLITALFLACVLFQASQVFAQEKKETEDGTIRIRIEKQKDGKTEVIEKTYKEGEWSGNFPGPMLFNFSDSFSGFGENFHRQFDHDFSYLDESIDSLLKKSQQLAFKFDYTIKPSLDSLLNKLTDKQQAFKFHFDKDFNMGSLLNLKLEGIQDFQFNWSGDDFNSKNFNLMLDKELYNVEETEDAKGNKMIRITPKTDGQKDMRAPFKNLRDAMQPSLSQLNLHHNSADHSLAVGFTLPGNGDTVLTVTDPKGKEVYKEKLKNFSGSYQKVIKLKKGRNGAYEVQVIQKDTKLIKKLEIP
jgi:hypothetical protein